MKISLGAIPINGEKEKLYNFYKSIAESEIDNVYLGEIVCPKRESFAENLAAIINMLKESRKNVYISSSVLRNNGFHLRNIKRLLEISDGLEINNMAFLDMKTKKEITVGPFLNVYNWRAAKYFSKFGIKKVVIPWEVGIKSIEDIAEKSDINIEVVVHGQLPLALSQECYTVRALNLSSNHCSKECFQYPEGFFLKAISGELLFKISGYQVFSAKTHCLIEYIGHLKKLKVESIRIESQLGEKTGEVINLYRKVLDNHLDAKEAVNKLKEYYSDDLCNGFFLEKPGWHFE